MLRDCTVVDTTSDFATAPRMTKANGLILRQLQRGWGGHHMRRLLVFALVFLISFCGVNLPAYADQHQQETLVPQNQLMTYADDALASGYCGLPTDDDALGTNLTWEVSLDGKTLTIGGSGAMNDTYAEQANRGTLVPWAQYAPNIETIVIGNKVTTIGQNFARSQGVYGTTNYTNYPELKTVTFDSPSSLISIGNYAFANYGSATSVGINNQITSINLPEGLQSLGTGVFRISKITSLALPSSVTTLGTSLFESSATLTELTGLGNTGVTAIPGYLFSGCTALTEFTIPNTITSIGRNAFAQTSLSNITIPSSVTEIGESAFVSTRATLTQITFQDNVFTAIAKDAFKAPGITSKNQIIGMSHATFAALPELQLYTGDVTASSSNTPAFNYVTDFFSEETVDGFVIVSGFILKSAPTDREVIEIPAGVTHISGKAFQNNTTVKTIKTITPIQYIGISAFSGCTVLKSTPDLAALTYLGQRAFEKCESLTTVTLPATLKTLLAYTFDGCKNLIEFNLSGELVLYGTGGTSNTSIGQHFNGCDKLLAFPEGITEVSGTGNFNTRTTANDIIIFPSTLKSITHRVTANNSNATTVFANPNKDLSIAGSSTGAGSTTGALRNNVNYFGLQRIIHGAYQQSLYDFIVTQTRNGATNVTIEPHLIDPASDAAKTEIALEGEATEISKTVDFTCAADYCVEPYTHVHRQAHDTVKLTKTSNEQAAAKFPDTAANGKVAFGYDIAWTEDNAVEGDRENRTDGGIYTRSDDAANGGKYGFGTLTVTVPVEPKYNGKTATIQLSEPTSSTESTPVVTNYTTAVVTDGTLKFEVTTSGSFAVILPTVEDIVWQYSDTIVLADDDLGTLSDPGVIGVSGTETLALDSYTVVAGTYIDEQFTPQTDGWEVDDEVYYLVEGKPNTPAVGTRVVGPSTVVVKDANNTFVDSGLDVTVSNTTFTGLTATPDVTVWLKGAGSEPATLLTLGKDYKLDTTDVKAGPATVSVEGIGAYTGKVDYPFTIAPAQAGSLEVTVASQVFTGEQIIPGTDAITSVTLNGVELPGSDWAIKANSYGENINVATGGSFVVVPSESGNLSGELTVGFGITPVKLPTLEVSPILSATYSGQEIKPALTIKTPGYELDKDYTVVYVDNVNVGTATAWITGKGNYFSSPPQPVNFEIAKWQLTDDKWVGFASAQKYNKANVYAVPTIDLPESEYIVSFGANILGKDAGSVTITPRAESSNVSGAPVTRNFDIYVDITEARLVVTPDGVATPKVEVIYDGLLLEEGKDKDYVIADVLNSDGDTRTLTITGILPNTGSQVIHNAIVVAVSARGLYNGTGSVLADVVLHDTSKTVNISNSNMTGEAYKLVAGTDYELSYNNSNNAVGTGRVTIVGKGDYADKFRFIQEFVIKGNIAAAQLGSIGEQAWTGSRVEPAVSVSLGGVVLVKGTDYTVDYLSSINPGIATAVITGMGNYQGTAGVQYSIVKPADVVTDGSSGTSGSGTNEIIVIGGGSTYTGGGVSGYTGGAGTGAGTAFGIGTDDADATDAVAALSLAPKSSSDKDSAADALKIDGADVPLANGDVAGLGGLPTWLVFLLGCLTMLVIGGGIYGFIRIKSLKQQVKELSWEFDK